MKMVKTFVSLVNAHPRVTLAREDFNDRKTHFVDISQPFPQRLLSLLKELMNKVTMMNEGYVHTHTTIWTPLTKADLSSLLSSNRDLH